MQNQRTNIGQDQLQVSLLLGECTKKASMLWLTQLARPRKSRRWFPKDGAPKLGTSCSSSSSSRKNWSLMAPRNPQNLALRDRVLQPRCPAPRGLWRRRLWRCRRGCVSWPRDRVSWFLHMASALFCLLFPELIQEVSLLLPEIDRREYQFIYERIRKIVRRVKIWIFDGFWQVRQSYTRLWS